MLDLANDNVKDCQSMPADMVGKMAPSLKNS